MPAKKKTKINLLPQEEFASSTVGRVLKWALSTFRIIVIVMEMIVMGAFLSRFWLDANNSDLTDSIKQKQSQILAQSDFEKDFRLIQNRLTIFKSVSESSVVSQNLLKISSRTPENIFLLSLTLGEKEASIKATSSSEQSIAQYIANLKDEKTFKDVSLQQVNQSSDNQAYIIFTIKLSY
ncbi:PilN domain-containing protein [Patescibacteria group bacterium]